MSIGPQVDRQSINRDLRDLFERVERLERVPQSGGDDGPTPFFEAVADLAATRDLRGYWRLGDGSLGPYADSSGRAVPVPMIRQAGIFGPPEVDMTDITPGALPPADDDGAVQFNSATGEKSDYLQGVNNWGPSSSNPFDADMGTIAGWVKPFASGATFSGAILAALANSFGIDGPDAFGLGYALGVEWPSRRAIHVRDGVRLQGPTLPADEWTFAVAVSDATSMRIYLNAALVASGPPTSNTAGNNLEPVIGVFGSSSTKVAYAAIDEVTCWFDPLTADEIQTLYDASGLAGGEDVVNVVAVSGNWNANPGDVVLADGTVSVVLPSAAGWSGSEITVKNVGVGTVTVERTGSETIDGVAADEVLATTQMSRTFMSDGSGWEIVGSYL